MSNKHHIVVNKTATYHTLGDTKTAKTIWFVLHGYGMLAEYFIKKFEPILNDETCIIAPEGLSKFYTQGFYGRVGATWMTKQDREVEIRDYINYLNQLYEYICKQNNNTNLKINLLGFSQGGATISRWSAIGKVQFSNLILWASVFPNDMNFEQITTDNTFLLYGDNDEFAAEEAHARAPGPSQTVRRARRRHRRVHDMLQLRRFSRCEALLPIPAAIRP